MSCQVMYQSYYQSYFNSYHPNTSPPAAVSSATAAANLSSGIAGNSGPSPPATVLDLHREAATASPHSPASSSTKSVRFQNCFKKSRSLQLWKVVEIFERNLDHLRRGEICLAFQRPFNLPFTRVLSWKIAAQECLVSLRQSNDHGTI